MKELFELITCFNIKGLLFTKTDNEIIRFFRYMIIGGIATVVDWGVVFFLTEFGAYYLISATIGFCIGLVVNYTLSKMVVFQNVESKMKNTYEFMFYALIGIAGLGLTLVLMWFLSDCVGIWYMYSRMISTFITLIWNYVARRLLYK